MVLQNVSHERSLETERFLDVAHKGSFPQSDLHPFRLIGSTLVFIAFLPPQSPGFCKESAEFAKQRNFKLLAILLPKGLASSHFGPDLCQDLTRDIKRHQLEPATSATNCTSSRNVWKWHDTEALGSIVLIGFNLRCLGFQTTKAFGLSSKAFLVHH